LAGLGVGSTLTLAMVGAFIFLAYGSTATVARLMGAGRQQEAVEAEMEQAARPPLLRRLLPAPAANRPCRR